MSKFYELSYFYTNASYQFEKKSILKFKVEYYFQDKAIQWLSKLKNSHVKTEKSKILLQNTNKLIITNIQNKFSAKILQKSTVYKYQLQLSMYVQKIAKSLRSILPKFKQTHNPRFSPTFFLPHHLLQSAYELTSPDFNILFQRQKIYFDDGGHVSLDWASKAKADQGKPIVLIMHGMTGGSQAKYMRALVSQATQNQFCSVCLNSRGINSNMTSPIPFVGFQFHELGATLDRIKIHYPKNPLYLIGASLGGNYMLRYLLTHKNHKIDGLSLISLPFDVKWVIDGMNKFYQKYFVKSYIQRTVLNHDQMKFWWESGIVDLQKLKQSKSLRQFHDRITTKILGFNDADQLFDHFKVKNELLQKFQTKTLIITAKDDPMVGFETFPIDSIKKNKNIEFIATQSGGHLCWFEGILPKRWYPKPIFKFFNNIQKQRKKDLII